MEISKSVSRDCNSVPSIQPGEVCAYTADLWYQWQSHRDRWHEPSLERQGQCKEQACGAGVVTAAAARNILITWERTTKFVWVLFKVQRQCCNCWRSLVSLKLELQYGAVMCLVSYSIFTSTELTWYLAPVCNRNALIHFSFTSTCFLTKY